MEVELSLKMPSFQNEDDFVSSLEERRDAGSVVTDFKRKAVEFIPGLSVLETVLFVDISDIFPEGRFANGQYMRLEAEWLKQDVAKISLLLFRGISISDEEAEKIFRKIVKMDKPELQKVDGRKFVVNMNLAFEDIQLAGHSYDSTCFMKKVDGSNRLIVNLKDREHEGKLEHYIYITDMNGTLEGLDFAKHLAKLGPHYIVNYNNLSYGDGKWRKIRGGRIKTMLANLISNF